MDYYYFYILVIHVPITRGSYLGLEKLTDSRDEGLIEGIVRKSEEDTCLPNS
jgi:hypothetical protein